MVEGLTKVRNHILKTIYRYILKPIFFMFDAELVHDFIISVGKFLGKYTITKNITSFLNNYKNRSLEQNILGINFKNPIGLSAGFDKDAILIDIIPSVGFGFMEVGSITGEACGGNPKPRLWRLKKSKSLAVYYGLKNNGCEAIAQRLNKKNFDIPIGINIAKTNNRETVDTDRAILDYFKTYETFINIGDYVAINISCPNAFGGQPFTDSLKLDKLLKKIISIPKTKPIFLKISPDLEKKEVDKIFDTALKYNIDGFICVNLTKNRDNKNIIDKIVPKLGGLSGKVVDDLSDDLIRYIYKKIKNYTGEKNNPIIIASGGVFNAKDAYKKIRAGASLVELMTGMIFEGPQVISEINVGLVKLLKADNYKNISWAIGKE